MNYSLSSVLIFCFKIEAVLTMGKFLRFVCSLTKYDVYYGEIFAKYKMFVSHLSTDLKEKKTRGFLIYLEKSPIMGNSCV